MSSIQIDQFQIGSHRNFVYLITCDGQSIVVDPQSDLAPWQNQIHKLGSDLIGVILTHTHWDHVAGVPAIVNQYSGKKLPIYLHRLDARRMSDTSKEIQDRFSFVEDEDQIRIGSEKIEVLHTPGHSAGECSFLIKGKPDSLLTGDTVFVGDVGRCDLESGSVEEMFSTLQRLKKLPPDTLIYPGHHYGLTPTTTVEREKTSSPAWLCQSVKELDALP